MYNEDIPTRAELPTTRQLIKSTVIAFAAAMVILVTIVWPADYAKDPTGIGALLGLTEMGEIKKQLQIEAEEDRLRDEQQNNPSLKPTSSLLDHFVSTFLISSASAQTVPSDWKEEIRVPLKPGQGAEIKLVMKKGAQVEYSWVSENGRANYDLHGDGGGQNISYKKGRGVTGEENTLEAAFDGNHGWFFRNRDKQTITIILRVRGAFSEVKKYL